MNDKCPLVLPILLMSSGKCVYELKGKDFTIKKDNSCLKKTGFYFVVSKRSNTVLGRYFVGNQRCKDGFVEKLGRFKNPRTEADSKIARQIELFGCTVVYLDYDAVCSLLVYDKNIIAQSITKNPTSTAQNFSEINRMINDKFLFEYQKY